MELKDDKPIYGVWLPKVGWLRGKEILVNGKPELGVFSSDNMEKTIQVARLIGRGAKVLFIDPSIVDLEQRYLEQEQRSMWQQVKNLLKNLWSYPKSRKNQHIV